MINVPNPKMGGYSLISETHISLLNQATHFLTYEADLLDNWKLNEWIDLFSQDARYLIAPLDDGEFVEGNALFLAVDNRPRLEARIRQLVSGVVWAEKPKSRTRRIITNIAISDFDHDTLTVRANFAVYQFRNDDKFSFIGTYEYCLLRGESSFHILKKKIKLDHENIQQQRRISIVL